MAVNTTKHNPIIRLRGGGASIRSRGGGASIRARGGGASIRLRGDEGEGGKDWLAGIVNPQQLATILFIIASHNTPYSAHHTLYIAHHIVSCYYSL